MTPTERDFGKKPLTVQEVERLFGDRPLEPFLNPRHEIYRSRDMGRQLPPRNELIGLLADNPNLMRRPLLVAGDEIIVGFDEAAYRRAAEG
jgi:arsenate reductase-like glutaredoxin family protein